MSFGDTTDLERSVIKLLTKSKVWTQRYMMELKEAYFTTKERRFIHQCMMRMYKDKRTRLSENVYQHEVDSRIDDKERNYYLSEWTLIQGNPTADSPEVVIDLLYQEEISGKLIDELERVGELVSEGKLQQAVESYKRGSYKINLKREDNPLREITETAPRAQLIQDKQDHPEKYSGIKTGFKKFDMKTGGLFPGELTVIAGITGLGKSTLAKQLEWNIITIDPSKNVLHIANEEYMGQVEHKFDAVITGIPYQHFKFGTIDDAELMRWQSHMEEIEREKNRKYGRLFVHEIPAFTTVDYIEQAYWELSNRGVPVHVIVIDHLPHIVPTTKAFDQNDEQRKAAVEVKDIARMLHLPVITLTQASTETEEQQRKGRRAGKMSVYGSKAQIHVANTYGIITDKGPDNRQSHLEEGDRDRMWAFDVKKSRDGGIFLSYMKHEVKVGRVTEITEQDMEAGQDGSFQDEITKQADEIKEILETTEEEADKSVLVEDIDDDGGFKDSEFDEPKEGESKPESESKPKEPQKKLTMLEKIRLSKSRKCI